VSQSVGPKAELPRVSPSGNSAWNKFKYVIDAGKETSVELFDEKETNVSLKFDIRRTGKGSRVLSWPSLF
jgi:hypothetical protein